MCKVTSRLWALSKMLFFDQIIILSVSDGRHLHLIRAFSLLNDLNFPYLEQMTWFDFRYFGLFFWRFFLLKNHFFHGTLSQPWPPPQIDGGPLGLPWFSEEFPPPPSLGVPEIPQLWRLFEQKNSGILAILAFFFKKKHLRNPKVNNIFKTNSMRNLNLGLFFSNLYNTLWSFVQIDSGIGWKHRPCPKCPQATSAHAALWTTVPGFFRWVKHHRGWIDPTSPKKKQGFIPWVFFFCGTVFRLGSFKPQKFAPSHETWCKRLQGFFEAKA